MFFPNCFFSNSSPQSCDSDLSFGHEGVCPRNERAKLQTIECFLGDANIFLVLRTDLMKLAVVGVDGESAVLSIFCCA